MGYSGPVTDYEQFKILLADPVTRAQMLSVAGMALTDEGATQLLSNEARCLMFYNQVAGVLQAKVQAKAQAQFFRSFLLFFALILVVAFLWWRAMVM